MMELSPRLKARVAEGGIDEVKIKALLQAMHGNEALVWDILEQTAAIERRAKADGVAFKADMPGSSARVRNAVNAGLRRYKEKQLDQALMAVEEAFENQYDAYIDAGDHAGADQLLQELGAWIAGRRSSTSANAAKAEEAPKPQAATPAPDLLTDLGAWIASRGGDVYR